MIQLQTANPATTTWFPSLAPSNGQWLASNELSSDNGYCVPAGELPGTPAAGPAWGAAAGPAPLLRPLHHAQRRNVQHRCNFPDGLPPVKPFHCTLPQVIEIGLAIAHALIVALTGLKRISTTNESPFDSM